MSRYRRFGDPLPSQQQQHSNPTPIPTPTRNNNDPWSIIRKLPTSSQRSSGSEGSPFSEIRYRATTLLRQPLVLVILGGGGTYYVLHLEKVEETGRWRFMDVSQETEQEMAKQSFDQVMNEFGNKVLNKNHQDSKFVRKVVQRLVESNGLETHNDNDGQGGGGAGWEVFVVKDDKTQNAFVIPGGKIFVFSGILPIAKDEDGLAIILGHEIAHQVARHSAERLSSMKVLVALSYLLTTLGIDLGLSRVLLNVGMTLPNSRKNETEADLIGLRLANKACYDPRAAESLWKRMDQAAGGGGGSLDFLSTHPSSSNRSVKVREWAEEVLRDRPSSCGPVRDNIGGFQGITGMNWK
ncbi:hypothetical protein JCM3765_004674 [Sporobolomyces pararoseus]